MPTRFAVVSLALGSVLLGVAFLLLHLMTPFDGARLTPGPPAWKPDGVLVTPIQEKPQSLQSGDVVIAIEGKSLESWAQALLDPGMARPNWRIGQTITYTVLRHGHRLDVPVTLIPYPLGTVLLNEWSTVLFALVFLLVAVFVFLRRPDDRAAQVQLLIGASITGATTWSLGLQVSDLVNGIGFWLFKATTFVVFTLFWVGILHFALIFPERHPIILRRSWVIPLIYSIPYMFAFAYLFSVQPGSASALDWIGRLTSGENILPPVYLILAIVAVIWGYRATRSAVTRHKLRWLLYAALLSGGGSVVVWSLPTLLLGYPLINSNALGVLVLPYPLVLPIAILRYRLWDIDALINKTLVYGLLTALLGAFYAGLIIGLESLASGITGKESEQPLALVISTLAIAALFQPMRRRLQAIIDRRFYRRKYDAEKTLAAFSATLRQEVDLEQLSAQLLTVVNETMQPSHISLWLRAPEPPARELPQHLEPPG
ncbi:MAG TPA: hypothetical protein VH599_09960 [Ktedonobacterales bacterium]|jgi:hypothetical protein